jgi:hypothetical protein
MRGREQAVVAALAALAAAGAGLAGYLHAGAPAALVAIPGALEVLGAAGLLLGLGLLGLGALLLRRRRR